MEVNTHFFVTRSDQVTTQGQRGLVIASKILQKLASEELFDEEIDPSYAFANLFIKKQLPNWKAFFYQFLVREG